MGEYLAHHGILGMHWGIRRYQPYPNGYKLKSGKNMSFKSAKDLKKKLNKSEQEYAKNKARYMRTDKKAKSKNNEKAAIKAKEYKALCDSGEKYINELLASGLNQGYSISVKDIVRHGEKGKHMALSMAFGLLGNIAYTTNATQYAKEYGESPNLVKSYKYDVKDNGGSYISKKGVPNFDEKRKK